MDNEKYYEVYDWSNFKDASENTKIIASLIPSDVVSIADVGCGNGLITNELGKKYTIVGIDRSEAALKNVTTDKLQASCDAIPLNDQSYDLVLSSELLEHLDSTTFDKTILELKRISRKYILISVPFDESLNKGMIQCPKCELIYHRCYHQRRFSAAYFESIFPEYSLIATKTFGLNVRVYNEKIAKIKHKLTPSNTWIPYYWAKRNERKTMCPKCENEFDYPFKFNPISFLLDCLNVVITKKIPFHLIVLLEKK